MLIEAKCAYNQPLQRRKSFSTSRINSAAGASCALRRGLMTMDHWGFNRSN